MRSSNVGPFDQLHDESSDNVVALEPHPPYWPNPPLLQAEHPRRCLDD